MAEAVLLKSSCVSIFIRDVSSTYASPILLMCVLLGVFSWKQLYLTARDHRMGSSTTTQIEGDTQLPCPLPTILRREFVWYVLDEMPWPILILYTVLFRIVVSIFAVDRGRPSLLQFIIAWGGTILL